ncbi:hypothetical protein SAV31267_098350 [Streptomyces avermitilis]|nr:hypothetical protein SAV31267_098350 [Streptomyces avermitilis]
MMKKFGQIMRDLGADREEPGPSEAGEGPETGLPDQEITTWVDTTEFGSQKFDALAAHASQGQNIFFLRRSKERFTQLMSVETSVRVLDTTGAPPPENDLFAGLR